MSADAAPPQEPHAQHDRPEQDPLAPTLDELLACLRWLAGPCEPPIGVGAFDVLYANAREVVVWYSPVRPEHQPGEVSIPTVWLAAAWAALVAGELLDEASLLALCDGRAGGARWVRALLAQAPGVGVQEAAEGSLALAWGAAAWQAAGQAALQRRKPVSEKSRAQPARSRRGRSRGASGK